MKNQTINGVSPLLTGVIALLFSIVMIAWPGEVVTYLMLVVGWMLVIIGGLPTLYALARRYPISFVSVICLVVGILVLLFQPLFLKGVMWLFGLILVLASIHQFNVLTVAKRAGMVVAGYNYLYPCVLLLAGVITLVDPFQQLEALVMFFGFGLLFYGITLLLSEIVIARSKPKIEDAVILSETKDSDEPKKAE